MTGASGHDPAHQPSFAAPRDARRPVRLLTHFAAIVAVAVCTACGSQSSPTPITPTPTPTPPVGTTAYVVGAGDIADCTLSAVTATARLLDSIPGTVLALGDTVYPSATAASYASCYAPTWGRHLSRTRPIPGNHDWEVGAGAAYFEYFGAAAGSPGLGYYAFDAGAWRVLALNTSIPIGGGSIQYAWVQSELASNTAPCTLVLMHHPLFSSSQHGSQTFVKDVWKLFYQYGVELVLTGHDHVYERFAPQDADGHGDPARGVREFVVGTGGGASYAFYSALPNSEAQSSAYGVLRLVLEPKSYSWQFVPIAGQFFSDSGTGACR